MSKQNRTTLSTPCLSGSDKDKDKGARISDSPKKTNPHSPTPVCKNSGLPTHFNTDQTVVGDQKNNSKRTRRAPEAKHRDRSGSIPRGSVVSRPVAVSTTSVNSPSKSVELTPRKDKRLERPERNETPAVGLKIGDHSVKQAMEDMEKRGSLLHGNPELPFSGFQGPKGSSHSHKSPVARFTNRRESICVEKNNGSETKTVNRRNANGNYDDLIRGTHNRPRPQNELQKATPRSSESLNLNSLEPSKEIVTSDATLKKDVNLQSAASPLLDPDSDFSSNFDNPEIQVSVPEDTSPFLTPTAVQILNENDPGLSSENLVEVASMTIVSIAKDANNGSNYVVLEKKMSPPHSFHTTDLHLTEVTIEGLGQEVEVMTESLDDRGSKLCHSDTGTKMGGVVEVGARSEPVACGKMSLKQRANTENAGESSSDVRPDIRETEVVSESQGGRQHSARMSGLLQSVVLEGVREDHGSNDMMDMDMSTPEHDVEVVPAVKIIESGTSNVQNIISQPVLGDHVEVHQEAENILAHIYPVDDFDITLEIDESPSRSGRSPSLPRLSPAISMHEACDAFASNTVGELLYLLRQVYSAAPPILLFASNTPKLRTLSMIWNSVKNLEITTLTILEQQIQITILDALCVVSPYHKDFTALKSMKTTVENLFKEHMAKFSQRSKKPKFTDEGKELSENDDSGDDEEELTLYFSGQTVPIAPPQPRRQLSPDICSNVVEGIRIRKMKIMFKH